MNYWMLLFAGTCGAACAAFVASLARVIMAAPRPDATREPPPRLWRWFSWPVGVLAIWPGSLATPRRRFRLNQRLRSAGLSQQLNAERFIGGKFFVAAICGAATVWFANALGRDAGLAMPLAAIAGFVLPEAWLSDRVAQRRRSLHRDLPFFLDILTLSVESGLNITGAIAQAVDRGPGGPLKAEFDTVLRDVRAGRSRAEALRRCAEQLSEPGVHNLVAALLSADRQGASLGPVLRAQADQRRAERFSRAEKAAMEAPVKMLVPLVLFIFPGTFAIIFFPIVSRFLQEGWLQ